MSKNGSIADISISRVMTNLSERNLLYHSGKRNQACSALQN